jgi:cyclohexadienyl dehydratase
MFNLLNLRFALLAGATAMLAACAAAPSQAPASHLDAVQKAAVLRICTPGDYRPYTDHDEASGAWRGSDVELARALAAHLGVSVKFVPTTWGALMDDTVAGRFDIAVGGISITARLRICP